MTSQIALYNTKNRQVEIFTPLVPRKVGIYTCGPTVYNYAHIGNLRAYVFADTLRRMFVSAGYEVKHIINITDVGHLTSDSDTGEDKLEKGALREGKSVWEIAKMYTDAYFKDLMALSIPLDAFTFPRATDHITEQIALVHALELLGYTYTIADGVYFDTAKVPTYADFAHLDLEGLQAGARVEENSEKRNKTDFALWKLSPAGSTRQMEWDSPWGKGFPGWHIECSAMAAKYLGNHFDVHTGGIDHIPVHHTNEIAQSEAANRGEYVNYWMHVNFLHDSTGKMSKSNEDFLTLPALILKGYSPLAYKYLLLTTHYRKELTFSFEALDAASVAYSKLVAFCREYESKDGIVDQNYLQEFNVSLRDDLNTSQALAVLWTMLKDHTLEDDSKYATLLAFDEMLGLGLSTIKKETLEISPEVEALLDARATAREEKNFAESDRLRDEIANLGFTVKDTAEGQILSRQ